MSKQQKSKEKQNYIEKPVFPMCSNCANFKSEKTFPDPQYPDWFKEKTTCDIGGFVVKKMATCDNHIFKS